MAVVEQLLRSEADGSISFGNHTLEEKAKLEDFPYQGDLYKVKTFRSMTKLEKNGMFLYESVPGTSVNNFKETGEGMEFQVEGMDDVQITLGLKEDTAYEVFVNDDSVGKMKTGLGGKLSLSVALSEVDGIKITVKEV